MGDTSEAIESIEPRLGEGELPLELDRLNWGAALLGMLWAIFYTPWPWFFVLAAARVVLFAISFSVSGPFVPGWVRLPFTVAYMSIYWVFVAMLAIRANRLVWDSERSRVERQSDQSVPRPAVKLSRYVAAQRRWLIGGVLFHLLLWGDFIVIGAADSASRYVMIAVDVAAITALFVFDYLKRRRSPS